MDNDSARVRGCLKYGATLKNVTKLAENFLAICIGRKENTFKKRQISVEYLDFRSKMVKVYDKLVRIMPMSKSAEEKIRTC
jgi:hypothetical protein